jgi:hypothetical protein
VTKLNEGEPLKPGWSAPREVKDEPHMPNFNISRNIGAWVGRATANSYPNGVPKSS